MILKLEDYQLACKIAAKLVQKFGDLYLPIFKRTLNELNNAKANEHLKLMALEFITE